MPNFDDEAEANNCIECVEAVSRLLDSIAGDLCDLDSFSFDTPEEESAHEAFQFAAWTFFKALGLKSPFRWGGKFQTKFDGKCHDIEVKAEWDAGTL